MTTPDTTTVGVPFPTQAQTLEWVRERWPDRCDPLNRAAKMCEEAGETIGAVIKTGDGTGRKTAADVAQETAQAVICAMALAESVGFDLWFEVAAEYDRCQVRVWAEECPGCSTDGSNSMGLQGHLPDCIYNPMRDE